VVEGLALTMRSGLIIALLLAFNHLGVAIFCAAFIAYAILLVALYYHYYISRIGTDGMCALYV
jgi:hypothetical protein